LRGAESVVWSYDDVMVLHGRRYVFADRVSDSTSQNSLSRVLALETVCSQLLVSDLLLLLLLCLLLLV
jgi:putative flippase GtrA